MLAENCELVVWNLYNQEWANSDWNIISKVLSSSTGIKFFKKQEQTNKTQVT